EPMIREALLPCGILLERFLSNLGYLETEGQTFLVPPGSPIPVPTPSIITFRSIYERPGGYSSWFIAGFPDVAAWFSNIAAKSDPRFPDFQPAAAEHSEALNAKVALLPDADRFDADHKLSPKVCKLMADVYRERTRR